MEIRVVNLKKDVRMFHKFPHKLYAGDENWVSQPHALLEDIFDLEKNKGLKNGAVCRWIVLEKGEVLGRVAAFVVDTYASNLDRPTGGIGFFECVDNQKVANLLLDTAIKWLRELKMEAVDAPINIGDSFFNWGVLTKGFSKKATLGMPYNKKYYQYLFKDFGFQTYYEQFTYQLNICNPALPERFRKEAERMSQESGFTYRKFSFSHKEGFVRDFARIHEQVCVKQENYKRIDLEDLLKMLHKVRFLIDEDLIWFVYHNDEPVAVFVAVPDMNQLFRKISSGQLNIIRKLKLLYYKQRGIATRCKFLVMSIVPSFQNVGLESAILYKIREMLCSKKKYDEMELSWVADFNPEMISLFEAVGGVCDRKHKTLRYIFDQSKAVKRAKIAHEH